MGTECFLLTRHREESGRGLGGVRERSGRIQDWEESGEDWEKEGLGLVPALKKLSSQWVYP